MAINVIGDVAGNYETLTRLMNEMPEGEFILVGDLVDRGPSSRKVIELCMSRKDITVCYGNHEDLFRRAVAGGKFGDVNDWLRNGGGATADCYRTEDKKVDVPAEHIEWLDSLPMWVERNGVIVSHAPIISEELPEPYSRSLQFIWNRWPPKRIPDRLTIHGHNGLYKEYADGEVIYSYCVDNSHVGSMVGLHVDDSGVVTKYKQNIDESRE